MHLQKKSGSSGQILKLFYLLFRHNSNFLQRFFLTPKLPVWQNTEVIWYMRHVTPVWRYAVYVCLLKGSCAWWQHKTILSNSSKNRSHNIFSVFAYSNYCNTLCACAKKRTECGMWTPARPTRQLRHKSMCAYPCPCPWKAAAVKISISWLMRHSWALHACMYVCMCV